MDADQLIDDLDEEVEEVSPEKDVVEPVMNSNDITRSRKIGKAEPGAIAYNFTGVDPATGKDRTESIVYNRDKGVVGINDKGVLR
jgi:hypothetical protein